MISRILLTAVLATVGVSASAASLNFADPAFASTSPDFGEQSTATVTEDGVTFTVTVLDARGTDGFRQNQHGLFFGTPGNGITAISISADQDITIYDLVGIDTSNQARTTPIPFDGVVLPGYFRFQDVSFGAGQFGLMGLDDFTLSTGQTFILGADLSPADGFNAIHASATLSELLFDPIEVAPVPLPAGAPLFLSALGAFAVLRKKKQLSPAA